MEGGAAAWDEGKMMMDADSQSFGGKHALMNSDKPPPKKLKDGKKDALQKKIDEIDNNAELTEEEKEEQKKATKASQFRRSIVALNTNMMTALNEFIQKVKSDVAKNNRKISSALLSSINSQFKALKDSQSKLAGIAPHVKTWSDEKCLMDTSKSMLDTATQILKDYSTTKKKVEDCIAEQ